MKVCLVMFRESGDRRDFPLTRQVTTIGRKDDCDIRVPLAEVSRHHAELTLKDDSVNVKDLGSANGTFLNNKRIKKRQSLSPGDHLVVGPVVFTVRINDEPAEVRPVKTKLRPMSTVTKTPSSSSDSAVTEKSQESDVEIDPISALEALASSTDQTAIDPFEGEDDLV